MSNRFLAGLLVLLLPSLCEAQSGDDRRTRGYFFAAPSLMTACSTSLVHFGGGAEWMSRAGLGFGGELGYLTTPDCLGCGLGALSANVSYHFATRWKSGKLAPFVTGGHTLLFREGSASLVNLGGGVNYWFDRRWGVRLEVRDQIWPYEGGLHLLGFRAGVTLR